MAATLRPSHILPPTLDKPGCHPDVTAMTDTSSRPDAILDVAVIGGGLAGLTQAIALASHGLRWQ